MEETSSPEREDAGSGVSTDSEDSPQNTSPAQFFGQSLGRKGRKQTTPIRYHFKRAFFSHQPQNAGAEHSPVQEEEEHEEEVTDVGYVSHSTSSSDHGATVSGSEDLENKTEDLTSESASSPGSTTPGSMRLHNSRNDSGALDYSRGRVFPAAPSGSRIFNVDAYCQLCDREFCNKYFLKTHKANKHGVYEEGMTVSGEELAAFPASLLEPRKSSRESSLSVPNEDKAGSPSSADLLAAGAVEQQFLAQQLTAFYMQNWAMQQVMQSSGMPPMPHHLPFFPPLPTSLPLFPMAFPPTEMTKVKVEKPEELTSAARSFSSDKEQQLTIGSAEKCFAGSSSIRCEVCNKTLSSRNFLRKHLRKKHGIVDAVVPGRVRDLNSSMPTTPDTGYSRRKELKLKKSRALLEASSAFATTMAPSFDQSDGRSNLHRLLQSLQANETMGYRSSFQCGDCQKEFASSYFLQSHMKQEHSLSHPAKAAQVQPEEEEGAALDLSVSTGKRCFSRPATPPSDSVQSKELNPNSIDLDSCCMKCSREYCSKYFLKTHLQKVHNLSRQEYLMEVSMNHPDVYQRFIANPIQTDRSTDANQASSSAPARRNWCRHCQRDFCNKYFFRTHMLKMHGEMIAHVSCGRSGKKRSTGVICEICQKEYCSKYFLKIHRRNAHGIVECPSLSASSDGPLDGSSSKCDVAPAFSCSSESDVAASTTLSFEMDVDKVECEEEDNSTQMSLTGSLNDDDGACSSPSPTQLCQPIFST